LIALVVDSVGAVVETDVIWEPYRLVDPAGETVASVSGFLHELQASGRSSATQRSNALDLLRWFRFLWAPDVLWTQATRCEARDFSRWLALVDKPRRAAAPQRPAGAANPVTGKRSPGGRYAASTLAHSETVLRGFYSFHLEAGSGPIVNPFPLVRERLNARAHAHHNPMEPSGKGRSGAIAHAWLSGSRAGSLMSGSTRSSPSCVLTGTGRWSRSGCRPGRGPRNCSGRAAGMSTLDSS